MSYRGREIESKLIVYDKTLNEVNGVLNSLYGEHKTRLVFGSSKDTYWVVKDPDVEADFARIRERDGIRQLTSKGKDRGSNLNRMETDVDSPTEFDTCHRLYTSFFGKEGGKICKTYYVYWISESEHTNISCYSVDNQSFSHIFVEVEATTMNRMLELEAEVIQALSLGGSKVERAPGSLFELFIHPGVLK